MLNLLSAESAERDISMSDVIEERLQLSYKIQRDVAEERQQELRQRADIRSYETVKTE